MLGRQQSALWVLQWQVTSGHLSFSPIWIHLQTNFVHKHQQRLQTTAKRSARSKINVGTKNIRVLNLKILELKSHIADISKCLKKYFICVWLNGKWMSLLYLMMIIVEANHNIGAHQPRLKKTSRSFKLYKQWQWREFMQWFYA